MTQAERSELISEIMDMLRQLGLITDHGAADWPAGSLPQKPTS